MSGPTARRPDESVNKIIASYDLLDDLGHDDGGDGRGGGMKGARVGRKERPSSLKPSNHHEADETARRFESRRATSRHSWRR